MEGVITLFSDPAVWAALVALIVMEVVLGIDNLIYTVFGWKDTVMGRAFRSSGGVAVPRS